MKERNIDLPMCVSDWCTCVYRQVHQARTHIDNIQPHTK